MKWLLCILVLFFIGGCGYSQVGTESVGQVKRVVKQNPIICNTRTDVDLSLGVMQNGVGSMSTQDIFLTVPDTADQHSLQIAAETGKLVKVTYDRKRFTFCTSEYIIRSVTILP